MEIIPGVYQFQIPAPIISSTNLYLIKTEEGCLLIDAGYTETAFQPLAQQLESVGVEWSDIHYVFITHAHDDHIGLLSQIKKLTDAQVIVHKRWAADRTNGDMEGWLRLNGVTEPSKYLNNERVLSELENGFDRSLIVEGGERIHLGGFDLKVIWTPGHALGHICLYEPQKRLLFAGDFIMQKVIAHVCMYEQTPEDYLEYYLNSLANMAVLPIALTLPAHGQVFTNHRQRVTEIIDYHAGYFEEIIEALIGGGRSAYQVSASLKRNNSKISWSERAPLAQLTAITETISHLVWLLNQGILNKTNDHGINYYFFK